MKLDDFLSKRWNSPSRVLSVAGCLALLYYVVFLSWSPSEWKGVSRVDLDLNSEIDHVGRRDDEGLRMIENTTLGFQKLFVINMPSRTDRRDATTLAFAVSNISVEFIEGVKGESIPEEALPPGNSAESIKLSKGIKGSWRSHMNALQQIVYQNFTTAMIFEDDVDWDIRLRNQLKTFALASRLLSKPTFSDELPKYDIQVSNNPETEDSIHNESSPNPILPTLNSMPLSSALASLPISETSPYGDPTTWDLLWLGHCGVGFPRPQTTTSNPNSENILLTSPSDPTVPLHSHLRAHPFGPLDALASSHPPHTRVYHRASGGALCTVAYAVSQRGARKLLAEFAVKRWGRIWDAELGGWCAGSDLERRGRDKMEGREGEKNMEEKEGDERVCLTVQPPIFAHHHPAGGESNIGGLGGGYARDVETKYVRWSVRMNLGALVRGGKKEELVDQWPDGEEVGV